MTERELEKAMEFLEGVELNLSDSYMTSSMIWTVLLGILTFGLVLFTAIVIKRARVLGVIAAVAQPIGLFAARQSVLAYGELKFATRVKDFIADLETKNLSQLDAEAEMEAFMTPMITELVFFVAWMVVAVACTVLLGIYMIMLIKVKPSVFGIVGLVLTGIKWVVFAPVNVYGMLLENMTEDGQILNDIAYRGLTIVPILLITVLAILVLVRRKKGLIPVAETVEEPVAEAEDTLAAEPVVEAVVEPAVEEVNVTEEASAVEEEAAVTEEKPVE